MALRNNHYELALEAYLRESKIPYIAVDEKRRSLYSDKSLKNVDFVVSPVEAQMSWLIDVKGRHFPSGRKHRYWKNWTTTDDMQSLAQWEQLFGPQFHGLFVFAYQVLGELAPLPEDHLFRFRENIYAFVGIRLDLYHAWARQISPKWKTLAMPTTAFRQMAQPLDLILKASTISGGDFDLRRTSEVGPVIV
ncbi:MAG: HYExAFE family protein [Pirellulales bacterium]